MAETQHPYDVARRLDEHTKNLAEAGSKQGDCKRCLDLVCRFNVTALDIVRAAEQNPMTDDIKQFTCDDTETDPLVSQKLGMIKDYE
ncbi:hypothetical protein GW756_05795 [bacterium]|nr:hypothetical protein [bacterium]NCQ55932.1 hypothetical protein [Candidatus Parcubacteria bacterium]NCS67957.1 hypothetical protein [Candidatus Peregrinibacteria bacterium]NCS96851.1 hypothetical protein [bacterium]